MTLDLAVTGKVLAGKLGEENLSRVIMFTSNATNAVLSMVHTERKCVMVCSGQVEEGPCMSTDRTLR